jgi:hypothetical protein
MKFTLAGILFMTIAWGIVTCLVVYTYSRVFKSDKKD